MAERRMFAKTIIDSDDFLNMPLSTQCLYFHLAMQADDEGFLNNPKKIQRMIGATEDDFRVLFSKKYVIPFDSGIVVIRHWKIHNYIRGDRLKNTIFQDEAERLTVDKNGAYVFTEPTAVIETDDSQSDEDSAVAECQSTVSHMSVRCQSTVSIGKDSIGKYRVGKDSTKRARRAWFKTVASEFSLSDQVCEMLERYLNYLDSIGKPTNIETTREILKKLRTLAESDADAVAVMEQAIRKAWKDLYPLEKAQPKIKKNRVGSFGAYDQRDFDYSDVEKKIRGYDNASD